MPRVSEKYERYESTGELTLADTDTTLIRFSGYPDSIVLRARSFGAIFTLQDFTGREESTITLLPNTTEETHLSRHVVRGRNLVAASNALVTVTGKWAERGEST